MHTQPVLQKFFRESLPEIHQRRCQGLTVAVDAVARGARVSITGLGRSLAGTCTRIKHRVKRMDRLIGNRLLGAQRKRFYHAIILRLLAGCPQPMILIDWSDFQKNKGPRIRGQVRFFGTAAANISGLAPFASRSVQEVQLQQAVQPAPSLPSILLPK